MFVRNTYLAAVRFGVAAILTVGCSEPSGPGGTAEARTIRVNIATAGAPADLDRDGYALSIDGGVGRPVPGNIAVLIPDVSPGAHLVQLDGLAPNCSVAGTNPRSVDVTGNDTTAPIFVSFSVTCIPMTGSIRISTVTSGPGVPSISGATEHARSPGDHNAGARLAKCVRSNGVRSMKSVRFM